MNTLTSIVLPSAAARLDAARARILGIDPPILLVAATRSAADEFAFSIADIKGATFGITRSSVAELVARLAVPALARHGLTPSAPLSDEAVSARVTHELMADASLKYFAPVADMPGFPRALSRTLSELRMATLDPSQLKGHRANNDLSALLERAIEERQRVGAVDYATMLETATSELKSNRARLSGTTVFLLDVAIGSKSEAAFIEALIAAAKTVVATIPSGDAGTLEHLAPASTFALEGATELRRDKPAALARLQQHLFADDAPPQGLNDDSVVLFSAPGEGRETIEIARRLMQEAERGVPFDQMAVLLRAPQTYLGVLEHALERAGIPAWFHRGTRRPDPAGRALLALLACADEELSARRFAEYISLGQVPLNEAANADMWAPPADEIVEAMLPLDERPEDLQPEEEAHAQIARGESDRDLAGTLRAPWRWEDLIVEAAVIGKLDRWQRRLKGLEHEYDRRVREASSEDPDASRVKALKRDRDQLRALRSFAEPILSEMSEWAPSQLWGAWLSALERLAPRVIAKPERVLRMLRELAPLSAVGPVTLREVRDVLTPRLSTLMHEPPRRRQGRVFVGTPTAARGRSFRIVFVPGLAERMFPQRIREDALLPDRRREAIDGALATQTRRAADERLQLILAVGAAAERLYVSYPRVELNESRQRVPSFYVLDIARAIEGHIPPAATLAARASEAGGATLAWPAPFAAATAIDDFEHDLATMAALLRNTSDSVKGRARYLYELSPELQRSLSSRWLRWHRKQWEPADGIVRTTDNTRAALAAQRLGARPYSLTALQRYSACPYQFLMAAVYRLAPLEAPAPLQTMDPLTRGDLFHQIQAAALRRMQADGLLPLSIDNLAAAQQRLTVAIREVHDREYDRLNPAIDRVWQDEIAAMTQDLRGWLDKLAEEGAAWTPERFEFAFGLPEMDGRDEHSTPEPAVIDGRFKLRGSIDMIERHRTTKFIRVTDHKTGKNRTQEGRTVVDGGRVLQPVIYGLALKALFPDETVFSGRLFYCTNAGGFYPYEIPLMGEAPKRGLEVLEIVDRAIDNGILAARPGPKACDWCDFGVVCGSQEERRTRRKDPKLFIDLDALRKMP
ncbi:MAG TPA: PD-(D/E)XK nuclease family protein [Vicinamibacterales bacterium]|nr:PD-(D/E)XK nuclease family protein [Vicinamibacterales bacterium]